MKKIKIGFGIVVGLLAVILISALLAYNWYSDAVFTPVATDTQVVMIDIAEGETFLTLGEELLTKGVIKSLEAYKLYLRINPHDFNLHVGSYEVSKNLNVPEILETIRKGPKLLSLKVTFPEGMRADEFAITLSDAYTELGADFDSAAFMAIVESPDSVSFSPDVQSFLTSVKPAGKSLEGFLFPDTYNIGLDASEQDIIELLITTLMLRLETEGIDNQNSGRLANLYDVLILASIVQREARVYEDMQMISDIFLRRLEEGWVLGTDAAVLYPYRRWTPAPNLVELEKDDPYNLRKIGGLTPTPIANSGIEAIKAVLNPISNPYYYFISDNNGQKHYAVTFADHQANVNRYLR